MQPIKILMKSLSKLAGPKHFLFTFRDLRGLFPNLSESAFKTLLSRAAATGHLSDLERVCRGLYVYNPAVPSDGLLLFHVAARLRADEFTYISLETALSDAGVISQIPINWISVMSSGRSNTFSCGRFGTIEFVHTRQRPETIAEQLHYDSRCGMWRASVSLALRDMRAAHRNLELIDWSVVDEFI